MPAAQNMVDFVRGFGQRAKQADVNRELKNYLNDPQAAIAAINEIDAPTAIALQGEQDARAAARRKERAGQFGDVSKYLRGLPEETDFESEIETFRPYFRDALGIQDTDIDMLKIAAKSNPGIFRNYDDDAFKEASKSHVAAPGSYVVRDGKTAVKVPYAIKPVTTSAGAVSTPFDPNTGEFITEGAGGAESPVSAPASGRTPPPGTLTVESVRPHIVQQESRGDYTARNTETGALGAYQVMPATGKTLAGRLKMPWRPDMMVKDDPASRRYQDAIGAAAIQEAIEASGGDPMIMAQYYHGGSDRSIWGPKTRQYGNEVVARLGGGGGGGSPGAPATGPQIGRSGVYVPPKPEKSVRAATPAEIAEVGYPAGTAAQIDSTGKMVNIKLPPKPAAPKTPTPRDPAKAQAVTSQLEQLAQSYVDLYEAGGIVDPDRTSLQNIGARVGSSMVGQLVGGAVGTEEQSLREQIINLRPLLISGIREATGMSSKAMDSNQELKFYLQAATDPTKDIMSNLVAIQVLDTAYGNGQTLKRILPEGLYTRVSQRAKTAKPLAAPRAAARPTATGANGEKLILSADGKRWERMN